MEALNDLYDYIPFKVYQDDSYFKFSLDAVLLAEYVKNPEKANHILDMCSGNAAVAMILSTKTNANIVSVEVQKEIFELGKKSIDYNNLSDRISIVNSDIKDVKNYFPGNKFDVIVCNPPYFKKEKTSYINNDMVKAIARHEILVELEDIIKISSSMLDLNGELYIVHRSERIDEIIVYCSKHNINVKNIQFITTKEDVNPRLVLIRAIKGSKFGVKVAPDLCIKGLDSFKNIFWKE